MPERTFRTKKGVEVVTSLTDQEAAEACLKSGRDLGQTLAQRKLRGGFMTHDQLAWLHKIAIEYNEQCLAEFDQAESGEVERNKAALDVFERAGVGNDYPPSLTFTTAVGVIEFKLSTQGDYKGILWVSNGQGHKSPTRRLYARVHPNGVLTYQDFCTDDVSRVIAEFLDDPAEYTIAFAVMAETCPVCGRANAEGLHLRCAEEFGFAE